MAPSGKGSDWVYRRRSFFGEGLESLPEANPPSPLGLPCEDAYQRVEITRVERWATRPAKGLLARASVRSERVDHAPSTRFPFSLPVRSGAWARVEGHRLGDNGGEAVWPSPARAFQIRRTNKDSLGESLVLSTASGGHVRAVKIWDVEFFEGRIEALGWAEDENRFFVVVTFEGERALLFFSVKGTDDYWEELLDPYDSSWADGFVLRRRRRG